MELRPLAKASSRSMVAVYGGVGYGGQRGRLQQGVDLVVACPGSPGGPHRPGRRAARRCRYRRHRRGRPHGRHGFPPRCEAHPGDDVQSTSDRACSPQPSTEMWPRSPSATSRDPVRHESDVQQDAPGDAEHVFWKVNRADRLAHTADAIISASPSIVFTRTRHGADRLARQLAGQGVAAVAMHGGRSQSQRNRALKDFSTGRAQALVATDVAARGHPRRRCRQRDPFRPAGGRKGLPPPFGEDSACRGDRAGRFSRRRLAGRWSQAHPALPGPGEPDPGEIGSEVADIKPAVHRVGDEKSPSARITSSRRVYVGNLPYSVTDLSWRACSRDHGPVRSASIVTYKDSGRSRGFGFVVLSGQNAIGAIQALDGRAHRGRRLNVREARTRP